MATRRRSSAAASSGRSARGGRGASAAKSRGTSGFRGAAGAKRAAAEKTKQDTRRAEAREKGSNLKPFRLYLKAGETKEVAIVDDQLDDLFFTYEHNMKNPRTGFYDIYTGCIKENQVCPVCEALGKESYYALMLTVIDFTPYTDKKGVEHTFSRKLMCVKPGQIGKFLRFIKREGTLRGAVFELSRDGDSDPQIGNDIEFLEFMDEDELNGYERVWEDRDGKKHKEKCGEVFDYDTLFPEATKEELSKVVGGKAAPGSSREAEEELDDDMEADEDLDDEDQDDTPWDEDEEEEEAPARGRRGKARSAKRGRAAKAAPTRGRARRGRTEEVDEEEEYEEEELDEEEEVYEDEVEDEVEEEEEAPPRRGRRGAASADAKPRGRAAGRRAGRSRR